MKAQSLMKLINEAGFTVMQDSNHIWLEPTHIRVNHLKIDMVKRGRFYSNPALVPPELKEKNVFWVEEQDVTIITQSGEEVPVIFNNPDNKITMNYQVINPEDNER